MCFKDVLEQDWGGGLRDGAESIWADVAQEDVTTLSFPSLNCPRDERYLLCTRERVG